MKIHRKAIFRQKFFHLSYKYEFVIASHKLEIFNNYKIMK